MGNKWDAKLTKTISHLPEINETHVRYCDRFLTFREKWMKLWKYNFVIWNFDFSKFRFFNQEKTKQIKQHGNWPITKFALRNFENKKSRSTWTWNDSTIYCTTIVLFLHDFFTPHFLHQVLDFSIFESIFAFLWTIFLTRIFLTWVFNPNFNPKSQFGESFRIKKVGVKKFRVKKFRVKQFRAKEVRVKNFVLKKFVLKNFVLKIENFVLKNRKFCVKNFCIKNNLPLHQLLNFFHAFLHFLHKFLHFLHSLLIRISIIL